MDDETKSEDVPYGAYLIDTSRRGSEEIDRREAIDHEEVKRRLAKWLEK